MWLILFIVQNKTRRRDEIEKTKVIKRVFTNHEEFENYAYNRMMSIRQYIEKLKKSNGNYNSIDRFGSVTHEELYFIDTVIEIKT